MLGQVCRGLALAALVSALTCCLLRSQTFAATHVDIDLSDFDDDSMRDMDDANKDLQPVIGARNAQAALADAEVIQAVLKQTESYFAKRGTTTDAVQMAQQGEASIAAVISAVRGNDFTAAAAAARDTAKNCRSCHDVYKPLTK
jgi:hypothetical protein